MVSTRVKPIKATRWSGAIHLIIVFWVLLIGLLGGSTAGGLMRVFSPVSHDARIDRLGQAMRSTIYNPHLSREVKAARVRTLLSTPPNR